MRHIYSHELGLKVIEHVDDLENHATVVVAVLRDGIDHIPRDADDIERIYCPSCGWLDPQATHEEECDETGLVIF